MIYPAVVHTSLRFSHSVKKEERVGERKREIERDREVKRET